MTMRLSRNFTLAELTATSHPRLQDTPTLAVIQNLQRLCVLVLQPLRDAIGRPVYINSGYRSKRLNARVGGVLNSRHLQGKAADIHCDNLDYAKVIFDILKQNPNVDKAIIERKKHSTWVHVQM
ncbi:MAG: peptidase M15 [Prevotella sp.]|nr:peptidase M15 [Prevotella sp.]